MESITNLDFLALIKLIKREKWTILLVILLFILGGVFFALSKKDEFISQGRILPEINGKGGGGLGQFAGLASLAGVDISTLGGSGVDAIRPDLYPDVITSTPFFLNLFKIKVKTKENKEYTFEDYYHQNIEDGKDLDEKLIQFYPVREEGLIIVNRINEIRLKDLQKRLTASIDKKSGIITITSKMPDPVVSATTARFAMEYLMEYVKDYRTDKLKKDVEYLEEQVKSSRGKYYSTQEKKAKYSDQFQDIQLQSADVQRERIESEYRISSTFYNELLKKYEEAKFRLHQETPVFQVLEPPVAPVKKSEPKRSILVFSFTILGGIIGLLIVILKKKNYKEIFYTSYVE